MHMDFAGPVEGKQLLIVVDAYSKWPEMAMMDEISMDSTLKEKETCSQGGDFPSGCDGQCTHPLQKCQTIATTESSPAQLVIGRDLRSRLHLLTPDARGCVLNNQATQVN